MDLLIQKASIQDIDELLGLYVSIYGDDYPLEIGTNKKVMKSALLDPETFLWLVMRDNERGVIAGSVIFELDLEYRIGKVTGAAVNKTYQGHGIATKLIQYGTEIVLKQKNKVNSLYATSRTVNVASQAMLLNNGFAPLGIFPNARKIKTYETLTLVGMFNEGVLEKRAQVAMIPPPLKPIIEISNEVVGLENCVEETKACPIVDSNGEEDDHFEFIFAPSFVTKRFNEIFKDDKESIFYPFHKPNLIIASEKTDLEIYASFNKKDHYCVWITANERLSEHRGSFKQLMFSMKELGIFYVETLIRVDYYDTICFLLENRFIPSAIYPAMREEDGKMHDYVLMTRTMVPLDFSDASIHEKFKPYVNQYAKQWLHTNLSIVEGIE